MGLYKRGQAFKHRCMLYKQRPFLSKLWLQNRLIQRKHEDRVNTYSYIRCDVVVMEVQILTLNRADLGEP